MTNKNYLYYIILLSFLYSCNQIGLKYDDTKLPNIAKVDTNKPQVAIELAPNEITIGNQIWKSNNSKHINFANGDPILIVTNANDWYLAGENYQPAICYYNNDPSTADKYGVIYNFYAIIDQRGIAPKGWKVPDISDIEALSRFLDKNLFSEIAVIENKRAQGIDVEEFWNELNMKYENYCPADLYPQLKYLKSSFYVSRDWKGKFEIFENNDLHFNGFWLSSTTERDLFNIIYNMGLYFNINECWKFNYSTFHEEISDRAQTAETKEIDFNHRGLTLRLVKTVQ